MKLSSGVFILLKVVLNTDSVVSRRSVYLFKLSYEGLGDRRVSRTALIRLYHGGQFP